MENFVIPKVEYQTFDGQTVVLTEKDVRDICGANSQYLTKSEIELYMKTAMYRKLNPFLRELFLLKTSFTTKTGEVKTQPAQIIVSKQAVMMIAEEHPAYDGLEHGIIVVKGDNTIEDRVGCIKLNGETLVGGWAKVYRKDRRVPFVARLDLKEYSKAKKTDDGKEGKGTWDTMICTMIDKCATVSALRLAFPQQLGGLYTNDEIKNSNFDPIDTTPTETKVYDIPETIGVESEKLTFSDPKKENPIVNEKEETNPVKTKIIGGQEFIVYPPNPDIKIQYATKEKFPEYADQYVLVDYPEKENRVAVQQKI